MCTIWMKNKNRELCQLKKELQRGMEFGHMVQKMSTCYDCLTAICQNGKVGFNMTEPGLNLF